MDIQAIAAQTKELLARTDLRDSRSVAEALKAIWLQGETYSSEGMGIKAEQLAEIEAAGVKVPILTAVGKELGKVARKRVEEFLPLARLLWDEFGREGRIVAALALGPMELADPEQVMPVIRELCRTCVTWEDCDQLAMKALEPIVRREPTAYLSLLGDWIAEENKWVRRAAVTAVGRLPMKHPEYTVECLVMTEALLTDPDLDVRRAVSFAIRVCARGDPAAVREFLHKHVGSEDEATVWILCDVIRSMTKALLPNFVGLLPAYQAWQEKLAGKSRRSVESAIETLSRVA